MKKTLFRTKILLIANSTVLSLLLVFSIGCSKTTKQAVPTEDVHNTFTFDSLKGVNQFLIVTKTEKNFYSVIECTKTSFDTIRCFAFNSNTLSFDTLHGYFQETGAFEIINKSRTLNIRASFQENGSGKGVISTPSTAIYQEFQLAPLVNDSFFVGGKDSVYSTVHTANRIEYQLSFPTFKHLSVTKNVIFTSMMNYSRSFFQQYVDSLNPKEFHFLKYKAYCKKIDNDIWTYELYVDSDNQKEQPLFALSFRESNASIVTTQTLKELLETYCEGNVISLLDTLKPQIDSLPFSNTIGISKNKISVYYPNRKTINFSSAQKSIQNESTKIASKASTFTSNKKHSQ